MGAHRAPLARRLAGVALCTGSVLGVSQVSARACFGMGRWTVPASWPCGWDGSRSRCPFGRSDGLQVTRCE
eukprot:10215557-Alexandrium_andersonii.AAC.1